MSNSSKMSFEEKIVQKIKESTMGAFIEAAAKISEMIRNRTI